jgi:hypothetical protein
MKPVVPPPLEVQRRGWECAWALHEDFWGDMTLRQRVRVLVVVRMHPDRLGWREIRGMLRLYRAVAGVRV